jgi:hypothetical protein
MFGAIQLVVSQQLTDAGAANTVALDHHGAGVFNRKAGVGADFL